MLSRLVARASALVVVVIALLAVSATPEAARPFRPGLPELGADIALPRWERARAELGRDDARLDACLADAAACGDPRRSAWRDLVRELEGRPRPALLDAVNRFVNAVPYASDLERYGVRDRWVGPWAFLAGAGDCEDYAIAKYATLRRLGVPVRDMRIVVVEDVARGLAHAVLAVRDGGRTWLLDNQAEALIDAAGDDRYAPYYAVNEERRWLFRLPERTAPAR